MNQVEIPEVELDRLRLWIEERDEDPKERRFFEDRRTREPERVARLREAVASFVGGGGLGKFADELAEATGAKVRSAA